MKFNKEKTLGFVKKFAPSIVVGCLVGYGFLGLAQFSDEREVLKLETLKLEGELALLKTKELDKPNRVKEVDFALATAKDAGETIANLQNNFIDFSSKVTNLSRDEGLKRDKELRDSLKYYLSDSNNAINWYPYETSDAAWRFLTNYEANTNDIPSVWICENKKGEVIGFAKGTYYAAKGVFGKIDVVLSVREGITAPVTKTQTPASVDMPNTKGGVKNE